MLILAKPPTAPGVFNWTSRQYPGYPSATNIGGVAYGNSLWVILSGGLFYAATSPDAITWTQRTAPAGNWAAVAFGGGAFVSVLGTAAMYGAGTTWSQQTLGSVGAMSGVAYGNGLFVATSSTATATIRLVTSPNGFAWTTRTTPASTAWAGAAYGGGLWVIVGPSTQYPVATSPDAATWTGRSSNLFGGTVPYAAWAAVAYGNGLFVAVGTNIVMTSPDGINWTQGVAPSGAWNAITYGNGLFVAVGGPNSPVIMTSPDGINWTPNDLSGAGAFGLSAVAYGNNLFVAVGNSTVLTSA